MPPASVDYEAIRGAGVPVMAVPPVRAPAGVALRRLDLESGAVWLRERAVALVEQARADASR